MRLSDKMCCREIHKTSISCHFSTKGIDLSYIGSPMSEYPKKVGKASPAVASQDNSPEINQGPSGMITS